MSKWIKQLDMLINEPPKFFMTLEFHSQSNKQIKWLFIALPCNLLQRLWIKTEIIYFWGGRWGRGSRQERGRGEKGGGAWGG